MPVSALPDGLLHALHALRSPPQPPGWNHDEIVDLLGPGPRTPAAVLIGIRAGATPTVILTRRNDHLRTHAGQVSFPGGQVDARDEDVVATALRESAEEIGLDSRAAEPLGFLDCFDTVSGYCVTPVVARIAATATLHPNPVEVAEVFEVPLAFLLDPARLHALTMDYRGRPRQIHEFEPYAGEGHRIWGATAAMLFNLMTRMART